MYVGRTKIGYVTEDMYKKEMPYWLQASNEDRDVYGQIVSFERLADYLTLCEVQVMG